MNAAGACRSSWYRSRRLQRPHCSEVFCFIVIVDCFSGLGFLVCAMKPDFPWSRLAVALSSQSTCMTNAFMPSRTMYAPCVLCSSLVAVFADGRFFKELKSYKVWNMLEFCRSLNAHESNRADACFMESPSLSHARARTARRARVCACHSACVNAVAGALSRYRPRQVFLERNNFWRSSSRISLLAGGWVELRAASCAPARVLVDSLLRRSPYYDRLRALHDRDASLYGRYTMRA